MEKKIEKKVECTIITKKSDVKENTEKKKETKTKEEKKAKSVTKDKKKKKQISKLLSNF